MKIELGTVGHFGITVYAIPKRARRGDQIGPEGPGSKNMGLWFHDPDGYRWELSVLARRK